jgi:serine phosphatase RsbU (regulator of sigma subunit)
MVINLKTGVASIANAAHNPPYALTRNDRKKAGRSLIGKPIGALGMSDQYQVQVDQFQLTPGEMILMYTDGLFDQRLSDAQKIQKMPFLESLREPAMSASATAKSICNEVVLRAFDFFGRNADDRPDDITIIIIKVPDSAKFAASGPPLRATKAA